MAEPASRRVVLVTGGEGGMGKAIRAKFEAAGDVCVSADLRSGDIVANVSIVADCERMIAETIARHGRLDVVVNAAGVWTEGPTSETTEAEYDRVLDTNLKGAFFTCRFAIPHLVETRGCIVNISSDYGLVGGPGTAVYCASKFGLNGLTKSLALELAPMGVRVNSLCPGDVNTPMLHGQAAAYGGDAPEAYLEGLRLKYPQKERARFIDPAEIAAAVYFMAARESAPLNGVCLPFEWGVTAGY